MTEAAAATKTGVRRPAAAMEQESDEQPAAKVSGVPMQIGAPAAASTTEVARRIGNATAPVRDNAATLKTVKRFMREIDLEAVQEAASAKFKDYMIKDGTLIDDFLDSIFLEAPAHAAETFSTLVASLQGDRMSSNGNPFVSSDLAAVYNAMCERIDLFVPRAPPAKRRDVAIRATVVSELLQMTIAVDAWHALAGLIRVASVLTGGGNPDLSVTSGKRWWVTRLGEERHCFHADCHATEAFGASGHDGLCVLQPEYRAAKVPEWSTDRQYVTAMSHNSYTTCAVDIKALNTFLDRCMLLDTAESKGKSIAEIKEAIGDYVARLPKGSPGWDAATGTVMNFAGAIANYNSFVAKEKDATAISATGGRFKLCKLGAPVLCTQLLLQCAAQDDNNGALMQAATSRHQLQAHQIRALDAETLATVAPTPTLMNPYSMKPFYDMSDYEFAPRIVFDRTLPQAMFYCGAGLSDSRVNQWFAETSDIGYSEWRPKILMSPSMSEQVKVENIMPVAAGPTRGVNEVRTGNVTSRKSTDAFMRIAGKLYAVSLTMKSENSTQAHFVFGLPLSELDSATMKLVPDAEAPSCTMLLGNVGQSTLFTEGALPQRNKTKKLQRMVIRRRAEAPYARKK